MTPQEWDDALQRIAQDRKLSGPEREALSGRLSSLSAQQIAAFRSRVFALARAEMTNPQAAEWVGWLEDMVKLLHPIASSGTGPVHEALFTPVDDISARIVALLRSVRRELDVCVFTITDDRIADALIATHRRGVAVRVLTDNDKAFDLGADIARLEAEGLPIRIDRTPAHMHHKFAVFDRAILLNGSYNWTRSAQFANCENVVVTSERRLVEPFLAYFEKRWHQLGDS